VAPKDLGKSAIIFRNQAGKNVRKTVLTPEEEPAGSQWYADSEQPDGEWALTAGGTQMTAVVTFPKDQVTRCNANWTAKADIRVTLSLWSAKRALAPGETLKLEADYAVSAMRL
jgi:hypothetical protein